MTVAPRVVVQPELTGIHCWGVLSGLVALHRLRVVNLRFAGLACQPSAGQFLHADVEGVHVVFDLGDMTALQVPGCAEVVFKRSCPTIGGTTDLDVRPLGLVAGYRTSSKGLGVGYAAAVWRVHGTSTGRRQALMTARLLSRIGAPPRLHWFETSEDGQANVEPMVIFQVKAWNPAAGRDPEDRERQNEFRAAVIRGLKAELGPAFVGGFVPDSYALAHHRPLVTRAPSSPRAYAALVRRAHIGVSTAGLHGSNPWKLVEYFAAGHAIVSQPIRGLMPAELTSMDGALFAETPAAIIEKVEQLVADRSRRSQLRRASRQFYRAHVCPEQVVARSIRSLGHEVAL